MTRVTIEELDRMFYERLRKTVVAAGYLPDITNYATEGSWEQARNTLRDSSGQLIDVFGVGSYDARDEKTVNKIVIDRAGASPGSVGGFPEKHFEVTSGVGINQMYAKKFLPDSTDNVDYNIRMIGKRTEFDRLASQFMSTLFHKRRHARTYNNLGVETDNYVLVTFRGEVDMSERNYMERLYRYTVEDVLIEPSTTIKENIPVMKTVQWYIHGNLDTPTDDNKLDEGSVTLE